MFRTEQSIIGLIRDLVVKIEVTGQTYSKLLCISWDPKSYKYHYNENYNNINEYK